MDFNGNQTVQDPIESFSAALKGFKQLQTMNKGLIESRQAFVLKVQRLRYKKRQPLLSPFLKLLFKCFNDTFII